VTSNKDNKRKNIGMNLYFFRGNTENKDRLFIAGQIRIEKSVRSVRRRVSTRRSSDNMSIGRRLP
jgi:hypothetical protein